MEATSPARAAAPGCRHSRPRDSPASHAPGRCLEHPHARSRFSGVGQARTERRPAAFHVAPEPAGTGGEIGPGFCTEFRSRLGGRSRSESWRVPTLLTGLQCVYFLVAYANSLSLATCLLNLPKTTAWPRRVCARRPGAQASPRVPPPSLRHFTTGGRCAHHAAASLVSAVSRRLRRGGQPPRDRAQVARRPAAHVAIIYCPSGGGSDVSYAPRG